MSSESCLSSLFYVGSLWCLGDLPCVVVAAPWRMPDGTTRVQVRTSVGVGSVLAAQLRRTTTRDSCAHPNATCVPSYHNDTQWCPDCGAARGSNGLFGSHHRWTAWARIGDVDALDTFPEPHTDEEAP